MLKTASSLALLLAIAAPPAFAADCLAQIDNLYVEYDLPASPGLAGSQTTPYGKSSEPTHPAGAFAASPPGRPALHSLPRAGGSLGGLPTLPQRNALTADQKEKLAAKLHEARAIEALGNEDKCMDLLHQAQAIAGKSG
jgi:hypothetical protein